jgi:hypothetical protein
MRSRLLVPVLAAAMAVLAARAADEKKSDDLDKKVTDIVKQVGDLFKNAKSVHTDVTISTVAGEGGDKKSSKVEETYDVQRPNHFALRAHSEGDVKKGLDVVCDGKKWVVESKQNKEYTEEEVDDSLDIGQKLMQLGLPNTGVFFLNVLTKEKDPTEALMEGVTSCSYAGKEKVDGQEAHHLKFIQGEFHWELWVAAEGKPLVLKMKTTTQEAASTTITETFKDWKIDAAPAKDVFQFKPGEGVKKVDSLSQQ